MPSSFELVPFPGLAAPQIKISALTQLKEKELKIKYQLSGPELDQVLIQPKNESPLRKDGLWQKTCFEAFLSSLHSPAYWELNLSPSGDWNVYQFDDYRKNQKSEHKIPALQVHTHLDLSHHIFELETSLNLSRLDSLLLTMPLLLGLTAVIETQGGLLSYWALSHPSQKPDFHLRKGWTQHPAHP